MPINTLLKEKALKAVGAAKADPTPSKIEKAVATLKEADSVVDKLVRTGTGLTTIAMAIAKLIGLT